ncbi:MAG: Lrp/AsnC ligand binding domain-containing protein [Halobacteria archaeon]
MPAAYVLINCSVDSVLPAIDKLREIEAVDTASAVTGKYDVIARVEVGEIEELRDIVAGLIHETPGVEDTTTCIAT